MNRKTLKIFPNLEISSRDIVIYYTILAPHEKCTPYSIDIYQRMCRSSWAGSNSNFVCTNGYLSITSILNAIL